MRKTLFVAVALLMFLGFTQVAEAQVFKYVLDGVEQEFKFEGWSRVHGDSLHVYGQGRFEGSDWFQDGLTVDNYFKYDSYRSVNHPLIRVLGDAGVLPKTDVQKQREQEANQPKQPKEEPKKENSQPSTSPKQTPTTEGSKKSSSNSTNQSSGSSKQASGTKSEANQKSGKQSGSQNTSSRSNSSQQPESKPGINQSNAQQAALGNKLTQEHEENENNQEEFKKEVEQGNTQRILADLDFLEHMDHYAGSSTISQESETYQDDFAPVVASILEEDQEKYPLLHLQDVLIFVETVLNGTEADKQILFDQITTDEARELYNLFQHKDLSQTEQATIIIETLESIYGDNLIQTKEGFISRVVNFFKYIGSFFTSLF